MSALNIVGRISEIFSDTEADVIGKGRVILVDTAEGPKLFKLCKLKAAATSLAAGMIAVVDDMANNQVNTVAVLNTKLFGGARTGILTTSSAPTTLTAGNWAFLQILGYASLLEGNACDSITAGNQISPAVDANKGRVGGTLTAPVSNTTANIGLYGDSKDAAFATAKANGAGVADTATLCMIFRNFWGTYQAPN